MTEAVTECANRRFGALSAKEEKRALQRDKWRARKDSNL